MCGVVELPCSLGPRECIIRLLTEATSTPLRSVVGGATDAADIVTVVLPIFTIFTALTRLVWLSLSSSRSVCLSLFVPHRPPEEATAGVAVPYVHRRVILAVLGG